VHRQAQDLRQVQSSLLLVPQLPLQMLLLPKVGHQLQQQGGLLHTQHLATQQLLSVQAAPVAWVSSRQELQRLRLLALLLAW
jgi:hypothetical protein